MKRVIHERFCQNLDLRNNLPPVLWTEQPTTLQDELTEIKLSIEMVSILPLSCVPEVRLERLDPE